MNIPRPDYRPAIYNVQLFDDLHYYLPDLLYNNQRFGSVQDVFGYLNRMMREHFDRYSANRRAVAAAAAPAPAPEHTLYYYTNIPTTFRILSELLGAGGAAAAAAQEDQRPALPSNADLVRETSIGTVTQQIQDRICPICHDTMDVGSTVRIISHCRHMFHRTCVDYWFGRSSQCPVCRYDICAGDGAGDGAGGDADDEGSDSSEEDNESM